MSGGPDEALDDAVELEAAVEAVGEAGEIALGVLGADVVVGAGERGLDVAQRRVHPAERRPGGGSLARAGDHREVTAAGLRDRRPAGEPVADHVAAGREVALSELLDLLLAEALDHRELEPARLAFGRGLDRGDDGRLARRAPAALAARALAAEVSVVDLHPAFELGLLGLALDHGPHQLVLHQPGGGLPDPEPSGELDRADPALALGQVVDGREPSRQRQLGGLEHRAGGQPDLLLATVALEQLTGLQRAEAAVAASRAGEARAPAHLEQRRAARLLGPEPFPELSLAQPPERTPQPCRRCHPSSPPAPKAAETLARNRMPVMDNQDKIFKTPLPERGSRSVMLFGSSQKSHYFLLCDLSTP